METVIHSYKTVQLAMESSLPAVHFLHGSHGAYHTAMLVAADMLRREQPVVIIDAANTTDPFFMATLFKSGDLEPEALLRRGYISRCYTFYQVDVTVTDGLPAFMRSVGSATLMVFGLLDLIDDDQVPDADIRDILERIHATLTHLRSAGIRTLLVSSPLRFQLKEREHYFTAYKGLADVIYRIDADYRRTPAKRGRHGTTDRNSHAADRQRTGAVGKLPPRAAQRTTGALR